MKKIILIFMTVIFVFIISLCIGGTVQSQSKEKQRFDHEAYLDMEREYLENVRDVLEQHECRNSGITMTYILDQDGIRYYELLIHHKYIDRMANIQKEELLQELREITFPDNTCVFHFSFLNYFE